MLLCGRVLSHKNERKEYSMINKSDLEFTDISSESARTYVFYNGVEISIYNPTHLNVSKSGGHRLLDAQGISHYIPPKWCHLYWSVKKGQPNFVK